MRQTSVNARARATIPIEQRLPSSSCASLCSCSGLGWAGARLSASSQAGPHQRSGQGAELGRQGTSKGLKQARVESLPGSRHRGRETETEIGDDAGTIRRPGQSETYSVMCVFLVMPYLHLNRVPSRYRRQISKVKRNDTTEPASIVIE